MIANVHTAYERKVTRELDDKLFGRTFWRQNTHQETVQVATDRDRPSITSRV